MDVRTYTCPHCGGNLTVRINQKRIVCDYCDSVLMVDGTSAAEDPEMAGYEFERGRQRAREESNAGQTGGYGYGQTSAGQSGAGSYGYTDYDMTVSPKNRLVALLLCVFLGIFGAHRFYVGKIGTGILYLFTWSLFGFGYIIDLILIIVGSFKDSHGLYVKNWQ